MMPNPTYRFNAAEALNFLVCFSGGVTELVEDDYGVKTDIVAVAGATIDEMFIRRLTARTNRGVTEATIQRAERFLAALHQGFIFEASALLSETIASPLDGCKQSWGTEGETAVAFSNALSTAFADSHKNEPVALHA